MSALAKSARSLRIGTRGSALALWQARHVAERLAALPGAPPTELVVIRTEGDRVTDVPLSQVEGKAFFTRDIEVALIEGRIDLAVHSLKDLATADPPGLVIAAVLEREDPRDALILRSGGAGLDALPPGARVGTSSLRRRALLARLRPDLELLELRGNVPTRLQRLDEGRYDAIVLAAAGLKRLGLAARIAAFLPKESLLPAPGQGALAVQVRADDFATRAWVEPLDHAATRAAATAERAFLGRLEGGCQVPVGALAEIRGSRLTLSGIVCSLDGRQAVEGRLEGEADAAEALGLALAEELLRRGADALLTVLALTPRSPLPSRPETAITGEGTPAPSEGDRRSGEGDRRSPLRGCTVAITRAEPPGGPLERRLVAEGARVLRWSAVEIHPPEDPAPLAEAAAHLERYDWIVFTSAHAVGSLAEKLLPDSPRPRAAAVGPSTAAAAGEAGFRVDRLPKKVPPNYSDARNEEPSVSFGGLEPDFSAAGLVESFRAAGDAAGARILLPASSLARPGLAEGLRALGALVEVVEAYRTLPAPLDVPACRAALAAGEVDAITFTSPSAVEGFAKALEAEDLAALLKECRVISIGPTTSEALAARGRAPDAEARPSTLGGVVGAVVENR